MHIARYRYPIINANRARACMKTIRHIPIWTSPSIKCGCRKNLAWQAILKDSHKSAHREATHPPAPAPTFGSSPNCARLICPLCRAAPREETCCLKDCEERVSERPEGVLRV